MNTKPELDRESNFLPGLAAVALFVVMALVFVRASFGEAAGFPADAHITADIGYAIFDLHALSEVPSEGFLVALLIIAVVLDAALDGAIMLARREDGSIFGVARTDGGKDSGREKRGDD